MFHRLLVALDGNDTASRAFDTALNLAADEAVPASVEKELT
ncbi:universal stress protein [Paraburkholderia sp. HP33-1]|nr:universal stress protein [Paraburkholderia sp. HP33-1]